MPSVPNNFPIPITLLTQKLSCSACALCGAGRCRCSYASCVTQRLRPSEREAAAKIYCEQALQGMGLTVDEVKLTQLPSGQASVEVWLTYQDEKQALEVRI